MKVRTSNADGNSESLQFLISMMGDTIDHRVAQRALDKYNGDVDKAADSLLSGDSYPDPYVPPPSSPANHPLLLGPVQPSTIDLTMDEDLPPDPNWAVVRSNVSVDNNPPLARDLDATQNDDINRAIEESLAYAGSAEEIDEELPPEERVRKDNRPVVLRPTDPKLAHVGLLWQALFFVPQVRQRIAAYRGPLPASLAQTENGVLEIDAPKDGPEGQVWALVELYGYLEMAVLAELTGMPILPRFYLSPWSNIMLGTQTADMLKDLAWVIETVSDNGQALRSPDWPRLFHSRFVPSDSTPEEQDPRPINNESDFSVLVTKYDDNDGSNDLISCLFAQLSPRQAQGSLNSTIRRGEVIAAPADVLLFHPVREELPSYPTTVGGGNKVERKKFMFPPFFFLDRFMQENEALAKERVFLEAKLSDQIRMLSSKKEGLVHFNNKDTLANLRTSIHYFEHIADPGTNLQRKQIIDLTALKLKSILTQIEHELSAIDTEISNLKAQSSMLFDTPDLQKHRYVLRVVLMHDGLYGRKHIYSYVNQDETWWMTLDHSVTQVSEETVLNDKSGLHLGAGPYLLLYSREIPEAYKNIPMPWADEVKEAVRRDSENLLNELPPEIRDLVYNPMSSLPPSPPMDFHTPSSSTHSDHQSSMDVVEA